MRTIDDDDLVRLLEEAGSSFTVPAHGPAEVLEALAPVAAGGTVVPLYRRRWARVITAAAVVAGAMAGGALLTGGGDGSTRSQLVAAPTPQASAAPESPRDGSLAAYADSLAPGEASLDYGSAATPQGLSFAPNPVQVAVGQGRSAAQVAGQAPPVAAPAPDGLAERVLKTGSLALIVADGKVTPTLTRVQEAGKAVGGYVQDGSTQESGETPSGTVVLRVPVAQFEGVVAKVRGLDAEVRSASTTGKDVTAQYADLEAQLKTLKATRERFLEILARTRTIGEILSVQQKVDAVTAQVDKIEGQRRVLERQAEYSTLSVTVTEADDPDLTAKEKPAENGLVTALGDAKDSFVDGVEGLVRRSGTALLVVLCLVVALGVGRAAWRISRRRLV
ncbi:MAG: DUF4349 domain-containing protein [Mycobacteriales bacterium]|nr:DUF4349 domain-containing protein [Mycobacteriales bacterium]